MYGNSLGWHDGFRWQTQAQKGRRIAVRRPSFFGQIIEGRFNAAAENEKSFSRSSGKAALYGGYSSGVTSRRNKVRLVRMIWQSPEASLALVLSSSRVLPGNS